MLFKQSELVGGVQNTLHTVRVCGFMHMYHECTYKLIRYSRYKGIFELLLGYVSLSFLKHQHTTRNVCCSVSHAHSNLEFVIMQPRNFTTLCQKEVNIKHCICEYYDLDILCFVELAVNRLHDQLMQRLSPAHI